MLVRVIAVVTMIFIDSEGEPPQELSALFVDAKTHAIVDVFHRHVSPPSSSSSPDDGGGGDSDWWARRYVHGLNRDYLRLVGLCDVPTLLTEFEQWLQAHPHDRLLAHAPHKEGALLQRVVQDVCLPPWKARVNLYSHCHALAMKRNAVTINGVSCSSTVHSSYIGWRPRCRRRRGYAAAIPSPTDVAKRDFGYHCSLYDCIECYLFFLYDR